MECPVCLETCEGVKTLCGHTFCASCISKVASTTLMCPLCRQLLLDESASCKVLNETIIKSMEGQPKHKRYDLLNMYKAFVDRVAQGILLEQDVGERLIGYLIELVGKDVVHPHMRVELSAAVVEYETYMKTPYEDWRFYKIETGSMEPFY